MTQAILLTTLLVLAAPAQTPRTNGKAKLAAAQQQFTRGDFEESLQLLGQALNEATDDGTLAQVHLLRGQVYGALRDLVEAEAALARALEHNPEATLDPNRVDPSLVTMLSGLKARLRGTLEVSTDRTNTRVLFDGRPLGSAPLRQQVEIGRHRVEVRTADGRYGARREVVIHARRTEKLELTLQEGLPDVPTQHGSSPVLFGIGKPLADLRIQFDPFLYEEGAGIELGGGLQSPFFRASFHFRMFPAFGVTLRGAFSVPVMDRLRGYVELEMPAIFYSSSIAFGLGGAGGVDYEINRWLTVFGQVGARHFFLTPSSSASRLSLQSGVRLQLP